MVIDLSISIYGAGRKKAGEFFFKSEFLAPPRKATGQGIPQHRVGFFCYFSCPLRKVKE